MRFSLSMCLIAGLAGCSSGGVTDAGSCAGPAASCGAQGCCPGLECSGAGICLAFSGLNGNGASAAASGRATGQPATGGAGSNAGGSVGGGNSASGAAGVASSGGGGGQTTGGQAIGSVTGVASTGDVNGSTTGSATSGSSAGTSGGCGAIASTEFQTCLSSAGCACGQSCVADKAFGSRLVCEFDCTQPGDCQNAAARCNGSTCAVNTCQSGSEGEACSVGQLGAAPGTCVPQSQVQVDGATLVLCLASGVVADGQACATSLADGGGNEDPYYSAALSSFASSGSALGGLGSSALGGLGSSALGGLGTSALGGLGTSALGGLGTSALGGLGGFVSNTSGGSAAGGGTSSGTGGSTPVALAIATPQIPADTDLCVAGDACNGLTYPSSGVPVCQKVCSTTQGSACPFGQSCVTADRLDPSWGFCGPCGASVDDGGIAAACSQNSDCCEGRCLSGACAP